MYVFLLFFYKKKISLLFFSISLFIVIDFFKYFLNYQLNQWFKSQILLCQNFYFTLLVVERGQQIWCFL